MKNGPECDCGICLWCGGRYRELAVNMRDRIDELTLPKWLEDEIRQQLRHRIARAIKNRRDDVQGQGAKLKTPPPQDSRTNYVRT